MDPRTLLQGHRMRTQIGRNLAFSTLVVNVTVSWGNARPLSRWIEQETRERLMRLQAFEPAIKSKTRAARRDRSLWRYKSATNRIIATKNQITGELKRIICSYCQIDGRVIAPCLFNWYECIRLQRIPTTRYLLFPI